MILGAEATAPRQDRDYGQQSHADDHVQRVHAGHREINPIEHFGIFHGRARRQMQLMLVRVSGLGHFRIERTAGD